MCGGVGSARRAVQYQSRLAGLGIHFSGLRFVLDGGGGTEERRERDMCTHRREVHTTNDYLYEDDNGGADASCLRLLLRATAVLRRCLRARVCVIVCDDCVWWWGESTRQGAGGGCDGDDAGVCDEMRRRRRRGVFQAALLEQCGHEHMVCGSACAGEARRRRRVCGSERERGTTRRAEGLESRGVCVVRPTDGKCARTAKPRRGRCLRREAVSRVSLCV